MNARRIIAAAISTVALVAVNIGIADSASAAGTAWGFAGKETKVQTAGTAWGVAGKETNVQTAGTAWG